MEVPPSAPDGEFGVTVATTAGVKTHASSKAVAMSGGAELLTDELAPSVGLTYDPSKADGVNSRPTAATQPLVPQHRQPMRKKELLAAEEEQPMASRKHPTVEEQRVAEQEATAEATKPTVNQTAVSLATTPADEVHSNLAAHHQGVARLRHHFLKVSCVFALVC